MNGVWVCQRCGRELPFGAVDDFHCIPAGEGAGHTLHFKSNQEKGETRETDD